MATAKTGFSDPDPARSRDALAAVIDAAPLAMIVIDAASLTVRLWNRAAKALFGWSADEVLGHALPASMLSPSHPEETVETLAAVIDDRTATALETVRRRRDGSAVDVIISLTPMFDGSGNVEALSVVIQDITARKQAERAQRDSMAALRAFYDNAPLGVGVVELSADGEDVLHIYDNPVGCRMLGVKAGETVLRRAGEMGVPAATLSMWIAQYRHSEAIGAPVRFGYSLGEDEAERWFSATVSPISAAPSGRTRFCYVSEDVTARHLAEVRLQESEERARLALESARLGHWSWDPRDDTFFADARARQICGLDGTGPLRLQDLAPRLHASDWPLLRERLTDAVRPNGRAHYSQELRVLHRSGVRWVVCRGRTLFRNAGSERRRAMVIGTLFDVSERKRNEELLREADRRKDEFLATLAHELRNPLAPIRHGVHLLRMLTSRLPAAERPLQIMERQLTHMVRLIDDLMNLSRVNSDKLELKLETLDLGLVIQLALDSGQPLIEAAGHTLELDMPAEMPVVDADMTRLAQVLSNLLDNAAKYTPAGGRVRVSVTSDEREAVISVEDSGNGVPPDMLPRIFDMFTQVDRTLERSRGGLGIGLAISRRLAELHGGRLEAHSDGIGQGTRFTLRLPLRHTDKALPSAEKGAQSTSAPAAKPLRPMRRRRVLIADDNADAVDTLCELLRLQGNDAQVARDGAQALALAAAFRPEIALIDLSMPNVDGFEVARRLRSETWGAAITLIAVTGWGQEEDRRRTRVAGFDGHLVKPIEPPALLALLEELEARSGPPSTN